MLLFEQNIPNNTSNNAVQQQQNSSNNVNDGRQDINVAKQEMEKVQKEINNGTRPDPSTTTNVNSPIKPINTIDNGANNSTNINNSNNSNNQNTSNNVVDNKPNTNISTNNKISEVNEMARNAYANLMEFCMENGISLTADAMADAKSRFLNEEAEIEGILDVDGEHVDDGSQADDVVDAAQDTDLEDGQEPDPEDIKSEVDDASDETDAFVNDQDEDTIANESYTSMLEALMSAGITLSKKQIKALKENVMDDYEAELEDKEIEAQRNKSAADKEKEAREYAQKVGMKPEDAIKFMNQTKKNAEKQEKLKNGNPIATVAHQTQVAKNAAGAALAREKHNAPNSVRNTVSNAVSDASKSAGKSAGKFAAGAKEKAGQATDWVKKNPGKAAATAAGVAAGTAAAIYGGKKLANYIKKKKAAKLAAQQEAYSSLIEFCMEAGVQLDPEQLANARSRFLEADVEINVDPEDTEVEINVDPEAVEATDEEIAADATNEAYTDVLEFCVENGISLTTEGVRVMQKKFF